jgi:cysteine desulfurase
MMIYLDCNATTPLAPSALDAMLPFLEDAFANPSSAHGPGMRAKEAVGKARAQVAALVGAKAQETVFTASATEANHLAILGVLRRTAETAPERRRIVASAVEHPSTLLLLEDLTRQGWEVALLPVGSDGAVSMEDVEAAVDGRAALVTMMLANNETGVLQPAAAAADVARRAGAVFHTDAVQAAGRIPVSMAGVGADLLTLSAHKMNGPKGAGALIVRKGLALAPLIFGHQERKRRGGTENVAALAGFGVAAELAAQAVAAGRMSASVAALRDRLEEGVKALWPNARINGAHAARLPNTSSILFLGADGKPENGEELLMRLDRAGICVSMGAACSAGGNEPSHVLTAMGLTPAQAEGSLRFSLGRETTAGEIDKTLEALATLSAKSKVFA